MVGRLCCLYIGIHEMFMFKRSQWLLPKVLSFKIYIRLPEGFTFHYNFQWWAQFSFLLCLIFFEEAADDQFVFKCDMYCYDNRKSRGC